MKMSLIIHLLVGGKSGKEKMKRIAFPIQQFGAESLYYSPMNSNLALYVCVMG